MMTSLAAEREFSSYECLQPVIDAGLILVSTGRPSCGPSLVSTRRAAPVSRPAAWATIRSDNRGGNRRGRVSCARTAAAAARQRMAAEHPESGLDGGAR